MRISDWSSDVCSSDLLARGARPFDAGQCMQPQFRARNPGQGLVPRDREIGSARGGKECGSSGRFPGEPDNLKKKGITIIQNDNSMKIKQRKTKTVSQYEQRPIQTTPKKAQKKK